MSEESRVNRYDHPRHYDHTAYLAKKQQNERSGDWEEVGGNPIVQVSRQALQPFEPAQDAISVSSQGKQQDTAETIARGTLIRSLPVIGLSLPLSVCIVGLTWMTGIVSVGFVGFVVSVLGLWGGFSLFCYTKMAAKDHDHSHYGVERLKVHSLTGIKHQELANDYALKRAALDAYIKRLEGDSHE